MSTEKTVSNELQKNVISEKKELSEKHVPNITDTLEKEKTSESPNKDVPDNKDSLVKVTSNDKGPVTKEGTDCNIQEAGRKFHSICNKCKKKKYTTKAVVLCCNCGVSLCKEHAGKSCTYKSHKLIKLVQNKHQGAPLPVTHSKLGSVCYHCKKNRSHSEASTHCYDCGKSYCNYCAEKHSKNNSTFWHDLWNVKELFTSLQKKQEKPVQNHTVLVLVPSEKQTLSSGEPSEKPVSRKDESRGESPVIPVATSEVSSEKVLPDSKGMPQEPEAKIFATNKQELAVAVEKGVVDVMMRSV